MSYMRLVWRFITVSVLLLGAGSAMAQVDYGAYGVADFSYGRFENSGAIHQDRFNSNSLSASFAAFYLNDTLDGGWKPGATVESFVRFQDLAIGRSDHDPAFSRNAFVSLGSDYGTLRVGRIQTLLFDALVRFNAFGNSTVLSPPVHQLFTSGHLESVQGDFFWNHATSYTSPRFEGLVASAMFADGPTGKNGDLTAARQDGVLAAANVQYSHGLFSAVLSGQRVSINDGIDPASNQSTALAAASYDFGVARVYGDVVQINDAVPGVRSQGLSGGASVPLGQGSLLLQSSYTHAQGVAVDRRHTSLSAGYLYNFDSLTDVYVLGMDDRISQQTLGLSLACGVRYRF